MMTIESTSVSAEAIIPTAAAARYLSQLCKHFQHKIPVVLTADSGQISFPMGQCDLAVTDAGSALVLRVVSNTPEALATLEDIVARHLLRFAFREDMHIHWTRQS